MEIVGKAERWFTLMERNERVQCTKDLSKFTLCQDVQLQHGLIVNLVSNGAERIKVVQKGCEKSMSGSGMAFLKAFNVHLLNLF